MEYSVIQRIRTLIEDRKESISQFGVAINMKQTTLNDYMTGQRKPAFALIDSILNQIPDVSAEWLMRGTGNMYLSENVPSAVQPANNEVIALRAELDGVYKTLSLLGMNTFQPQQKKAVV